jgi:hypothetical protein
VYHRRVMGLQYAFVVRDTERHQRSHVGPTYHLNTKITYIFNFRINNPRRIEPLSEPCKAAALLRSPKGRCVLLFAPVCIHPSACEGHFRRLSDQKSECYINLKADVETLQLLIYYSISFDRQEIRLPVSIAWTYVPQQPSIIKFRIPIQTLITITSVNQSRDLPCLYGSHYHAICSRLPPRLGTLYQFSEVD